MPIYQGFLMICKLSKLAYFQKFLPLSRIREK